MNVIIIAYLFSALACFESALTVYRLNRQSKLNRLYAALAASFSIYSIIMIQFFLSPDESACWRWYRAIAIMACVSSILGVRFILELTGIRALTNNKAFLAGFYFIPVVIALPAVTLSPVISGFGMMQWGWDMVMKISGWPIVFHSYLMVSNFACFLLVIRWRCTATTVREKKQAGTLIIPLSLWGVGLLHLLFPPSYPDAIKQALAHLFHVFCFTVFMALIRYTILKYKLMTITPNHPASELFNGMSEALFVTNTGGDIIFMNENAMALARRSGKATHAGTIFALFSSGEFLKKEIDDMIFGRQTRQHVISMAGGKAACMSFEISILGIKNETGELIGLMVIVREAGGARELQGMYRLSVREMEVFILLSSGLSAHEIALECDISLQTAKSHIHNIYQKTGLRNRVELSNLLNRHL